MRVLLVEPNYKNKYPPMGLMKISTYHKMLGDEVRFVKGVDPNVDAAVWDRIYITTLFTFDFSISAETILHYMRLVDDVSSLYVGGIMASLMPESIVEATGIDRSHILTGLFTDTSVVGDNNDINVDQLPLDYDILEDVNYKYPAGDNYFAYTTRGCPNHCSFCAVPILEPNFHVTNNIVEQIKVIDQKYGPKQHLLLLDNNVLNTPNLESLVDDLCAAGFGRDAKYVDPGTYNIVMMRYHNGDRAEFLDKKMIAYLDKFKKRIKSPEKLDTFLQIVIGAEDAEDYAGYMLEHEDELSPIVEKYRSKTPKARYLDFNQGVDGRKINDDNMTQLARLAIKPLRIAFDDIKLKDTYCAAVRTAHRHGIKEISNYILFNYKDKPEDLYERLKINIELNRELGIQIFSFPMKYSPINRTDRSYIGVNWTKKSIRAISAILQVTKGVVAAGSDFFYKAFGNTLEEYFELLAMPRELIMFRHHFEENGTTATWKKLYQAMSDEQKKELMEFTSHTVAELKQTPCPEQFREILPYYLIKYNGKKDQMGDGAVQLSLMDDSDIVFEDQ
jgi:radical SAM domain protein